MNNSDSDIVIDSINDDSKDLREMGERADLPHITYPDLNTIYKLQNLQSHFHHNQQIVKGGNPYVHFGSQRGRERQTAT